MHIVCEFFRYVITINKSFHIWKYFILDEYFFARLQFLFQMLNLSYSFSALVKMALLLQNGLLIIYSCDLHNFIITSDATKNRDMISESQGCPTNSPTSFHVSSLTFLFRNFGQKRRNYCTQKRCNIIIQVIFPATGFPGQRIGRRENWASPRTREATAATEQNTERHTIGESIPCGYLSAQESTGTESDRIIGRFPLVVLSLRPDLIADALGQWTDGCTQSQREDNNERNADRRMTCCKSARSSQCVTYINLRGGESWRLLKMMISVYFLRFAVSATVVAFANCRCI